MTRGIGTEPMVRLERVSRRFGTTLAVEDVSLSLEQGAFLTILGPSGCGKTTLLRMIAGFITPSSGEIVIHGRPVAALPPWRRRIGMVFQKLALFPHLTAFENVAYPLRMRGFPATGIPERVERYLALVRLAGYGARRPHELSGGQQQRVAIARALVFEPDLLLLDEPLAALDRKLREDMQLEFRRIQQELGVTTINVTHDQREALVMSDRILVMDKGRVQQAAPPLEAYARPANRFVAGFLGLTNFLPGEVLAVTDGRARLKVGSIELEGACADPMLAPGRKVEAAVRAERVRLLDGATACDVRLEAEVSEVVFEGDRFVYEVRAAALDGLPLRLFDLDPLGHPRHRVGDSVMVGWRMSDLMVFPA
ncbi:ABC transporter ATP-binding protein [Geminicoccaceae bacterium SYSU G07066]|uniref:ABC transporter ATP-binding protein n=2 Tax=Benzoatithermus flavus TaxID=3108223 RepID=A0ABU8XT62_9PROT